MMQKYVHPKAYLPDSRHGSCWLAAMIPAGLVLLTGRKTLLANDSDCESSRSVNTTAASKSRPATLRPFATAIPKEGIIVIFGCLEHSLGYYRMHHLLTSIGLFRTRSR